MKPNIKNDPAIEKNIPPANELIKKNGELERKLEYMKKENEELKRQLKEKTDNQQSQVIHQNQVNDSETNINYEKIEDIKIKENNKYVKVMMNKICVMKEKINQEKATENQERLTNEIQIMKLLNHPNVLKLESDDINDRNQKPSILIEYCPNNLEEAVKSKMMSKVQQIFSIYQIAEGMKYIHSRNIIHNNLIPANIQMTSDGIIKISEFENSLLIQSEELNEEEHNDKKKKDISSFGDLVYFILSSGETTRNKNESTITKFSLLAQQLIEACLCSEPDTQPSFELICEVLTNNDFNLISLTEQEHQELTRKITEYKNRFSF
ncbi:Serine/threonine-protein kinase stk11 [Tritrichomonas musculus]|uniref:Serine/threonine-protein kinase stk11 n=1 Tax=Tritrichomonas musculus TaxID=1915356 RepID=A0ABR2KR90_9EUKA